MTDRHPTATTPRADWRTEMPQRFIALCDTLAIASPEQGWILALALRDNPEAFDFEPFEETIIEEVVRKLTPVQRPVVETGYFGPMPTSGAMNPRDVANEPGIARTQSEPEVSKDTDDA